MAPRTDQRVVPGSLAARRRQLPHPGGGAAGPGLVQETIEGWEDFKGLKFRIYGIGADVFKEAGMAVVTLPGAEILPAAERGVIDGAEWVGGIEDLKLGFHNVWKYHYTPACTNPPPLATC